MSMIENFNVPRTSDFIKRVIDDIMALSFILGNDFIPQFPDIESYRKTFTTIISVYSKVNIKKTLFLETSKSRE